MFTPLFLSTHDGLGRFDASSLPSQTRMELLIDGLETEGLKRLFRLADGEYRDVCAWSIIMCIDSEVDGVYMEDLTIQGSVDLQYMPLTVKVFRACRNRIAGSADLTQLSPALEHFDIANNHFKGEITLTALPHSLRSFTVAHNFLTGSLNLSQLPPCLEQFIASSNRFQGEVDFASLPSTLRELDISINLLRGPVDFKNLPKGLVSLLLYKNRFTGSFSLDSLPPAPETMDVSTNVLLGQLRAHHLPKGILFMNFADNLIRGEAHVVLPGEAFLNLQGNKVSRVLNADGQAYDCDRILLS